MGCAYATLIVNLLMAVFSVLALVNGVGVIETTIGTTLGNYGFQYGNPNLAGGLIATGSAPPQARRRARASAVPRGAGMR